MRIILSDNKNLETELIELGLLKTITGYDEYHLTGGRLSLNNYLEEFFKEMDLKWRDNK